MTQWLIEEAAFLALEINEMNMQRDASEEAQTERELLARHAELTAIRERMKAG